MVLHDDGGMMKACASNSKRKIIDALLPGLVSLTGSLPLSCGSSYFSFQDKFPFAFVLLLIIN